MSLRSGADQVPIPANVPRRHRAAGVKISATATDVVMNAILMTGTVISVAHRESLPSGDAYPGAARRCRRTPEPEPAVRHGRCEPVALCPPARPPARQSGCSRARELRQATVELNLNWATNAKASTERGMSSYPTTATATAQAGYPSVQPAPAPQAQAAYPAQASADVPTAPRPCEGVTHHALDPTSPARKGTYIRFARHHRPA